MPRSRFGLSAAAHGGFAEAVGSQSGQTGFSFLPGKDSAWELSIHGEINGPCPGCVSATQAT